MQNLKKVNILDVLSVVTDGEQSRKDIFVVLNVKDILGSLRYEKNICIFNVGFVLF